jgi:two-component system OmpR family sensor kinase/two-component system sensor histidine kinase QseC
MTASLRVRLLASMLATMALAALLFAGVTYRNVLRETERLFDYQLAQMAMSLRDAGVLPEEVLDDSRLDVVIQIWSLDGRQVFASRRHASLPARAVLGLADISAGTTAWRTYSVVGRGRIIQVAQPVEVRRRLAASAALSSTWPLGLLALPLGALVWWQVSRALEPLRLLSRHVGARESRLLSPLPDAGLPDEAVPLVQAFNTLLSRLAQAFDAQRSFVADAAHELRSPLTALKLQLQLLRRAQSHEDRAEAMEALSAGVERAGRLVEQLLALAREEPGAPQRPLGRVDLGEAVREAVRSVEPFSSRLGSTVEVQVAPGLCVQGDADALAVLVRNLLDNALRYAGNRATVRVSAEASPGGMALWVDDSGPGVPAADRARVFDRFWRRDSVSAPDATGSGLGMAIVKRIADRHGATVALDDSPLGGLRVALRFPPAGARP